MLRLGTAMVFVASLLFGGAAWAAPPEIDWSVADRYRLFKASSPPKELEADSGLSAQDVFLSDLAAAERARTSNPLAIRYPESGKYDVIRGFLGNDAKGLGPMAGKRPYEVTRWEGAGPAPDPKRGSKPSPDRRYEAGYLYPESYTIRLRALNVSPGAQCTWRSGDLKPKSLPCGQAMRMPVQASSDHSGSVEVMVELTVTDADGGVTEAAPVRVRVVDRLIISLGESYAAGEGNPDRPQRFGEGLKSQVAAYWKSNEDPYERWWRDGRVLAGFRPAQWWDPVCHRSLYSQHAIASFLYAAERPREAVTFASFACSGTEVLDGLLAPQQKPPGIDDFGLPGGNPRFRMRAQLEDALILLCDGNPGSGARANLRGLAVTTGINDRKRLKWIADGAAPYALTCAGPAPRKVSLVLLSVGGNDVGFSGAVKNVLFPTHAGDIFGLQILSGVRKVMNVTPVYVANRKIGYALPALYPEVRRALRTSLAPDLVPIVQSSYPNPLEDQGDPHNPDYRVRSFCHGADDNRLFGAMHGMFLDEKMDPIRRWRLEITEQEGRDVYDALFLPLNAQVDTNKGPAWTVLNYGEAFTRRGWCAGLTAERQTYGFPGWREGEGWVSFDPDGDWDPYAPRTRLFRTANDVVLTQVGSATPMLGSLGSRSFFATSGMFHPTAQANTIMGLFAMDEMLKALPEGR